MATTDLVGYRYLAPGDTPDLSGGLFDLATDIEKFLPYRTDPSTGVTSRWNGSTWQEWDSDWNGYGPNFSGILFGTGFAATARWRWAGGDVHIEGSVTIGAGGSVNGQPRMSVPVARPGSTTEPKGVIRMVDQGTQDYSCVARWLDTATIGWNYGTATNPVTASSPFAAGPTDVLSWDLVYAGH